jgi:hypothetical protein
MKELLMLPLEMNLEESKVMNIEKYGNTICYLTFVLHDFEHLLKRRYSYFCCIWEDLLGVYLKWAYDKK